MIITVHVDGFYDWEKLPDDIEPSDQDKQKKIVKPSGNGGWLARVPKKAETETIVALPEHELAMQIVRDCMKEHVVRSRPEAVAIYLARHVLGHHTHRSWMRGFDVENDDGPNVAMFTKLVDEHVAAGNLQPEDKADLLEAYTAPSTCGCHKDELHKHFKVAKDAKAEAPS